MFKVLLVDDEVFVRRGLQKLMKWEEYKFTLVGEAKNGGEALDMINRLKPDVVITDIMLPVLDGLGLIRSVKEAGQVDPEFIIISGHDDFKYAQQAIRYGVQDYILKPIDVKELGDTLQRLVVSISRKHLTALTEGRHALGSVLEVLLQEDLQEHEAARYIEGLGIESNATGFLFAWAEIQVAPGEQQVSLKVFQEVLSSFGRAGGRIPVLENMPGRFGMLLSAEVLNQWGNEVSHSLAELRAEISRQLINEVTIFAGDIVNSIVHLQQSYFGANESVKHKYAEDGKNVILYGKVKSKPLDMTEMAPSLYNQLMVELEENNKQAFVEIIDGMFLTFRNQRFALQTVVSLLCAFNLRVIDVIKQMYGDDEEQRRLLKILKGDHQAWSLQRLKEHFLQMTSQAAEYIAQLRKEQNKGDIEKIKKFIDTHYSENINLKSIAAQFYMNSVYLGQLFRKTYGAYFNGYLLKLRVEEAKKLLRQTDLRMYEIAARVGIPNANYFVTQFEKWEKVSPLEYRNKLVNKK
ncbi:response regulator [Paenibacillus chondroitinus]|uniref:Response regulator n=1 Tax=Paenibacillus chondroitinus TaxID=59842 RepID=A0ABU6DCM2_9BACL|nr:MULTISPECIES: response regulator [Paenibacillus]MCY9659875.1 response regulator [Paenibacillus anseongense]MEB4795507.1 response regulator [Paenibacillus chondroitinus]